METNTLLLQDLNDLIQIHAQRAMAYNKRAYLCSDLQLKMLLNRETDNARDHVFATKRAIHESFEGRKQAETTGQLFHMWSDVSPTFETECVANELFAFEMSDFLVLKCYNLLLSRPYLTPALKLLLECQYYDTNTLYTTMKSFNESYLSNKFQHATERAAHKQYQHA
jgi:hypothetical protein